MEFHLLLDLLNTGFRIVENSLFCACDEKHGKQKQAVRSDAQLPLTRWRYSLNRGMVLSRHRLKTLQTLDEFV